MPLAESRTDALVGLPAPAGATSASGNGRAGSTGGWKRVDVYSELADPFRMPAIQVPRFPDRIFDIREHGAVGDGKAACTCAIARAICACSDAGGGRVLVPAGDWFTGPIHLRSNVELHLAAGSRLIFSDDPRDYLPAVFVRWGGQECWNYSPLIYARDCVNVALSGEGAIFGRGKTWWPWSRIEQSTSAELYHMVLDGVTVAQRRFASEEQPLRPQLFLAINCENVLLEQFHIAEAGPYWNVQLTYCTNVVVRGLRIDTTEGPNNDGIVIDSSRNVLVEHCDVATREDCVSIKSGLNEDGWRVNRPTENVVIRHIRASAGQGAISIGSELSGGVKRVLVHDCRVDGPVNAIRLKAARGRGGVVEHVYIRDFDIGTVSGDAIQITSEYASFVRADGRAPTFRNIHISGMACAGARHAARMIGLSDSPLRGIELRDLTIASTEGLQCTAGKGVHLSGVRISPKFGPVFSMRDTQDVVIEGYNGAADHGHVLLDLRGRLTRDICLRGDDTHATRPAVVIGVDVPRDALTHS